MKMLVCVDGSEQSKKVVKEAINIAGGCNINEVSLINVYESNKVVPPWMGDRGAAVSREELDMIRILGDKNKEKSREILSEAGDIFEANQIEVSLISREGHSADTIIQVANDGKYDMLVIGSRGQGGLKKLLLGSVSNAVMQEVVSNVVLVK